jgi:hypothetical protein
MKQSELQKLVSEMVKKEIESSRSEIRESVKIEMYKLLPGLISEVMEDLVEDDLFATPAKARRKSLKESIELEDEEYPDLVEVVRKRNPNKVSGGEIALGPSSFNVNGTTIPTDVVPPHIARALTRDYSKLMKAVGDKR